MPGKRDQSRKVAISPSGIDRSKTFEEDETQVAKSPRQNEDGLKRARKPISFMKG